MILATIIVAGISTTHHLDVLSLDYRQGWQFIWSESGVTYVAARAGQPSFVFQGANVSFTVDYVKVDTVFRGGFE